jgi:methylase of polypeptide subunit release factors
MTPPSSRQRTGSIRVSGKYAQGTGSAPLRMFSGRELMKQDKIFSELAAGNIAVVEGAREQMDILADYISRRQRDIPKSGTINEPLFRLMIEVDAHSAPAVEPPIEQAHLALLCGEDALDEGEGVLVPYTAVKRLIAKLSEKWHVDALGTWLTAGEDVLPPRSQETYSLFKEAIAEAGGNLPTRATILDMGCGCGVLGFIAAKELSEKGVTVRATDVMPEAIGSALINAEKLIAEGYLKESAISISQAGDMFERLGEKRYDMIIFNAPWVVAPVRSRSDVALNDEKQQVLEAFLAQVGGRLSANGSIILGYADNSGDKAVERAKQLAADAGFCIAHERSARVATHRKKNKWERILVWELRQVQG